MISRDAERLISRDAERAAAQNNHQFQREDGVHYVGKEKNIDCVSRKRESHIQSGAWTNISCNWQRANFVFWQIKKMCFTWLYTQLEQLANTWPHASNFFQCLFCAEEPPWWTFECIGRLLTLVAVIWLTICCHHLDIFLRICQIIAKKGLFMAIKFSCFIRIIGRDQKSLSDDYFTLISSQNHNKTQVNLSIYLTIVQRLFSNHLIGI